MNDGFENINRIIEAALMVAGQPLTIDRLIQLFDEHEKPDAQMIRASLAAIAKQYELRGIELKEVASGFRFQAKTELSAWLSRLWEERPPRYSKALLESLVLIAYRQPITRSEIEEVRGVAVSTHIIKTLLEREWVKVVGYREVPGKPALYGTTKAFLDYFNLKNLSDLPTLADIKDLEAQTQAFQIQLDLSDENKTIQIDQNQETTAS